MLNLDEARTAVGTAGWTTPHTYRKRWHEIPGLPEFPERAYPLWPGWSAFLTPETMPFQEAQRVLRRAGVTTSRQYKAFRQSLAGLPINPQRAYREWSSWPDFLSTARHFLNYEQARAVSRAAGIRSSLEYIREYRKYPGLPSNPYKAYDTWESWEAFLGKRERKLARRYLEYQDAMRVTRSVKISSAREYVAVYHQHPGLPSSPYKTYLEWQGWPAFLGLIHPRKKHLTYQQAMVVARAAGIRDFRGYTQVYQQYPGLPSTPNTVYPEWKGWRAFLGPKPRAEYEEAREIITDLGIRSRTEYIKRYKEHPRLPREPKATYLEWRGWRAFLGRP